MRTRKRSQPHTFEQRLDEQRQRLEQELSLLPNGARRDAVAARIEQLQAAAEMHEFLTLREDVSASG